jgi:hypothetical protein
MLSTAPNDATVTLHLTYTPPNGLPSCDKTHEVPYGGLCGKLLFKMGKSKIRARRVLGGTCEAPAAYNTLTPCGPTQPPGRLSPVPWITWPTRGYREQGGEVCVGGGEGGGGEGKGGAR